LSTNAQIVQQREMVEMPKCKGCGEDADELVSVLIDGKRKKLCEDCAEEVEASDEIARESVSVIQNMMGFRGRR